MKTFANLRKELKMTQPQQKKVNSVGYSLRLVDILLEMFEREALVDAKDSKLEELKAEFTSLKGDGLVRVTRVDLKGFEIEIYSFSGSKPISNKTDVIGSDWGRTRHRVNTDILRIMPYYAVLATRWSYGLDEFKRVYGSENITEERIIAFTMDFSHWWKKTPLGIRKSFIESAYKKLSMGVTR